MTFAEDGRSFTGGIVDWQTPWSGSRQPGLALRVIPDSPQFGKPGDTIVFTAQVAGAADPSVIWSATAGTIDEEGRFTVPDQPPGLVVMVTATAKADARQRVSIPVRLSADAVLDVSGIYQEVKSPRRFVLFQEGKAVAGPWQGPGNRLFRLTGILEGQVLTGDLDGVDNSDP